MGFHQKANLLGNIFSHLTEKLTGLIWEIYGYIEKTQNIPENWLPYYGTTKNMMEVYTFTVQKIFII